MKFAKVMFLQVSVCPRGGHGCQGVCVVAGVCVLLPWHAWLWGACVVVGVHGWGGMHGYGGHAWLWGHVWLWGGMHGCGGVHGCRGVYVVVGGMHGIRRDMVNERAVHSCLG